MTRVPIILDKSNSCPYDKPYGYIYLITNLVNGHRYVGKHRQSEPKLDTGYHGSGRRLWRAYKKYGKENFSMEILEWVSGSNKELNEREIFWIDMFKTFTNHYDYNETPGGDGQSTESMLGSKNPMWGNHRWAGKNNPRYGKPVSEGTRRKVSIANTGKTWDSERKQQWSKRMMGENNPNYGNGSKISGEKNYWYGKHLPESVRRKMSEAAIGKYVGEKNPMYGRRKENSPVYGAKSKVAKKVAQYTRSGEFIKVWDCMADAQRAIGRKEGISDCCRGRQKTCGGFVWKYYTGEHTGEQDDMES